MPPTVLFAQMHNTTTIVVYFRGPSVQIGQFLHHCVMNKPGLLPQNLVHTSTGITSLQESIPHYYLSWVLATCGTMGCNNRLGLFQGL